MASDHYAQCDDPGCLVCAMMRETTQRMQRPLVRHRCCAIELGAKEPCTPVQEGECKHCPPAFPSLSLMAARPRRSKPRIRNLGNGLYRCRSDDRDVGLVEGFGSNEFYSYCAWKVRLAGICLRLGIDP